MNIKNTNVGTERKVFLKHIIIENKFPIVPNIRSNNEPNANELRTMLIGVVIVKNRKFSVF